MKTGFFPIVPSVVILGTGLVLGQSSTKSLQYLAPDGGARVVVVPIGKDSENRIEFRSADNDSLCALDYSSEDGEHGFGVVKAEWTPDSLYFVFSLSSSGGHHPWHAPTQFYSRRDGIVRELDDYFQPGISKAGFQLIAPNTVRTEALEGKPVSVELDALPALPSRLQTKPFLADCKGGRLYRVGDSLPRRQDNPLELTASDFESKGAGLTETLLKFSHQQHLRIAIEYVDRASIDKPVDVSLRNETVRQALDSILRNGQGYSWRLRNEVVEITNSRASKRAQSQLNAVIPVFTIPDGETAKMASAMLWWNLQLKLDKKLRGFAGPGLGGLGSPTLKAATLHNRTVREILAYIVLNGGVDGWIVAGPPACLGFTPYCGLWFLIEGEPSDPPYQILLRNIRNNL